MNIDQQNIENIDPINPLEATEPIQENFIPLVNGILPRVEGPLHRQAIAQLGDSALKLNEMKTENIEQQAELSTDALTGIASRPAFIKELDKRIENAGREDSQPFAVLLIDLDNFKRANDTLGHNFGDKVLSEIANTLNVELKLRDGEILARLGGDEFVVIVNVENTDNSRRNTKLSPDEIIDGLIERLTAEVSVAAEDLGAPFVGASIGSALHKPGVSAKELLEEADKKMYETKKEKISHNLVER